MSNDHQVESHTDYCFNESRLATLEAQIKNKRYDLKDLRETLNSQAENINTLTTEVTKLATILQENQHNREEQNHKIDTLEIQVTQVNATMNTLKWILTVFIALFGGLMVFLVSELIKLIH